MKKAKVPFKHLRDDLLIIFLSFIIIFPFSMSRDIFIDEATSFFCSKYYLTECKYFEPHSPIFYFFLKISVLILGFDVIVQRLFFAILSSVSVLVIIRSVGLFRKLKLKDKLFFTIIISVLPIIYTSSLVRPYVLSLLFSSLSFFSFLKFLRNNERAYLLKSYIFDIVGGLFFYFNFLLIPLKLLALLKRRELLIKSLSFLIPVSIFLIPLFFNLSQYTEAKLKGMEWYRSSRGYFYSFLSNFPVELLKHVVVGEIQHSIHFFVFAKISQIIFLSCIFVRQRELVKIYILLLALTFAIPIILSTQDLYFIFSRQYIPLTALILTLTIILFPLDYRLLLILPLTYAFQTFGTLKSTFSDETYGPCYKIYENLPNDSKVLLTYPVLSHCLWYYEMNEKKNIQIFELMEDDWFRKDVATFRQWNMNAKEHEMPITVVKRGDFDDFTKVFIDNKTEACKEIIKEINLTINKIFICK